MFLIRLLDVVTFLAKQNLPFGCHREDVTSTNRGNFLELVELLSKCDPVLGKHYTKECKNNRNYLSPQIQNELTGLLGKHVKDSVLNQIHAANYFAVILDGTPDVSHVDQISLICRFVATEDEVVKVRESFLGFLPLLGKTASDIKKTLLGKLEEKLEFANCKRIGFDNAAAMAGVHGGVQRLLRNINGKANFIPCSNHSLNLCGVHASSASTSAIIFFAVMEKLFVFFRAQHTVGKF